MKSRKNQIATIVVVLILVIATGASIQNTPNASAHTPPLQIPTYAFIHVAPNPIGVGQTLNVLLWVDKIPDGAAIGNDIRFRDYKLTITKPDGTTETKIWDICIDTTSSQFYSYTPDTVGNYTFTFTFPQQTYTFTEFFTGFGIPFPQQSQFINDTYLSSTASTTLTVQQDPIPAAITSYPLPTEYWTRPIEGQNTNWYTISSNWLGPGSPDFNNFKRVQYDGTAPNSPHIMWSKSIEDGGIIGGTTVEDGQVYAENQEYNPKFVNTIIMNGRLIYESPYGDSEIGGGLKAVDLRTGETLWQTDATRETPTYAAGPSSPVFGYLYDFDSANEHGVLKNGLIFTNNFARSYDPTTGKTTTMNITKAPQIAGTLFGATTTAYGPNGEILVYEVTNTGSNNFRLTQWNSSKVVFKSLAMFGTSEWYSGTIAGNAPITPAASGNNIDWNGTMWVNSAVYQAQGFTVPTPGPAYDWNMSLPALNGLSAPSIISVVPDEFMVGTSTSLGGTAAIGTPNPYTFWAISLKPENLGNLLWIKNHTAPSNSITLQMGAADTDSRVFTLYAKETGQYYGYSMDDGSQLWVSDGFSNSNDYYNWASTQNDFPIYNGKLYYSGYGGVLQCIDIKTGKTLWTYGNGGEGNSTYAGLESAWGNYPLFVGTIADGKVYMLETEHSPNTPLTKSYEIRCINATDGTEIWTLPGYAAANKYMAGAMLEADGYLVFVNDYDHKIYSVGKGPSAITVDVAPGSITQGSSLVIKGTVTDIAAGTKQPEQAARFPNGVPAVSDQSQSDWMAYVYMQKPRPTDVTGVTVELSVVDANGNYREIGTTTSNSDGFFTFNWKPDIEGQYTVYAIFAGSESYWPSHAVSSFAVDSAAPTSAPTAAPPQSTADLYFVPAIAGLFVAIVVVGALLALLLLRKRP
jgi:hypothetical protein